MDYRTIYHVRTTDRLYLSILFLREIFIFRQDQIPAIHTACVLRPFYSRIQNPDSCHIIGIGPVYLLGKENREYKIYASVPYCHRCSLPNSVVQNSINNMMKRQEAGDTFANEDYIRVIQFNYFTKEHFKSPVEYILGSGIPNPRTKYGQPFYTVDPTLGPYNGWQDWGIVGLSWMIGIPAVLALLFPVFRIIRRKCDDKILFLKFFYIFLLLSSFTTIEFYRVGSFFFHGLLFYLYELYHRHSKHDNIGHTQKVLGQTRRVVNS